MLRCGRASRSRSGTVARRSSSGFPGNPVSALVGCLLFVVPAVLALQGAVDPRPRFLPGVLAAPMRRNAARDDFVRARSRWSATGVELEPITGQESHMIVRVGGRRCARAHTARRRTSCRREPRCATSPL